jgi:UDPglucose 6-dehydrogenase
LLRAGAKIRAHDPVACEQAARALAGAFADAPRLLENLTYVQKPMEAVQDADALVIVTEWKNYRSPNLRALRLALRTPLVIDGRNLYDLHQLAAAGLTYLGIGRNNLALLKEAEVARIAQALVPQAAALPAEPALPEQIEVPVHALVAASHAAANAAAGSVGA